MSGPADRDDQAVAARLSAAIAAALDAEAIELGAVSINAALGALVEAIGRTIAAVPDRNLRRRFSAEVAGALPRVVARARDDHVRRGLPDAPVYRRPH
jgi:hypothetical protein